MGRDGHGVSPKGILNSFKNPTSIKFDATRKTFEFTGKFSTTVLNQKGKIVTVIAKSRKFWMF